MQLDSLVTALIDAVQAGPSAAGCPVHARPAPRVRRHARVLPLKVGTRGSPLALAQTRSFLRLLTEVCPVLRGMNVFQEHAIRTTGDATQAANIRLADIGGKELFAKEIHEALLDGRVDVAVHSLKDLETALPPGIALACVMPREDPRDTLVFGPEIEAAGAADPYAALPYGAVIGTSSVRRQAQLLHVRPDLQARVIRGNVQNRLDKTRRGEFGATLLALAGLKRLGLEDEASVVLDTAVMVPSACQGIVGITARAEDTELLELLAAVDDPAARVAATAERALLHALDGTCSTPAGAYARLLSTGDLEITGLVASIDGTFLLRRCITGDRADAARMGSALGEELRAAAPASVFA
jgi:hydroxymethylbilane synthase